MPSSSETILNDLYSSPTQADEAPRGFSLFTRFPPELSSAIWKCALQHHRLISITLTDTHSKDDYGDPPPPSSPRIPYTARNGLGNTISGENYRLSITTDHRPSPLLRTSHGSRKAALEFYRVHLPRDWHARSEQTCLYLNPEFDFVHISPAGAPEVFVDFVHDAKAYDPLGVGILNMVIGADEPSNLVLPMSEEHLPSKPPIPDMHAANIFASDPSSSSPTAVSAFAATLTNLRRVIFRQVVLADTGYLFTSLDLTEKRYNRSLPINSLVEAFDLVETDPRPIDPDLYNLFVGWDPRATLYLWREMERNFQIQRRRSVKLQYLITTPRYSEAGWTNISTRADAERVLRAEEKYLCAKQEEGWIFRRVHNRNPDTLERRASAPVLVVGFWLFPLEAFGDVPVDELGNVPQGDFEQIRWSMKAVVDVTGHRPQLGVFRLPCGE